jgi:hypothetical protein
MNPEGTNSPGQAFAVVPARGPMQVFAYVDPAGRLRADTFGWPGSEWAKEAAGQRWLAEFVHTDDVAAVRDWLQHVFVAPIAFRIWIGNAWQTLLAHKIGGPSGWVLTTEALG